MRCAQRFEAGRRWSCAHRRRADQGRALAPEVACVLVPPDRGDLLEIDLTELTYG